MPEGFDTAKAFVVYGYAIDDDEITINGVPHRRIWIGGSHIKDVPGAFFQGYGLGDKYGETLTTHCHGFCGEDGDVVGIKLGSADAFNTCVTFDPSLRENKELKELEAIIGGPPHMLLCIEGR